jgi:hypothetical protein
VQLLGGRAEGGDGGGYNAGNSGYNSGGGYNAAPAQTASAPAAGGNESYDDLPF